MIFFDAVRLAEIGVRVGSTAGRVAGSAIASSAASQPGAGKVPADSEAGMKSTLIGVVIFAGMAPVMIAILVSGYQGHVSLGECAAYCLGGWGLIAAVASVMLVCDKLYARAVLRNYAAPSKDTETADMRAYLARLQEQAAAELTDTRHLELPAALDPEREALTQALFSVPCREPVCRAQPPVPCVMGIAVPVALLNTHPITFCHLARIRDAIASGAADADDIAAMFRNNVPWELL